MNIEDAKLFRIVTIPRGNFEGQYRVYWNAHILQKYEPDTTLQIWGDCWDADVGDWVESYDGTCLQILKIRTHQDKQKKYPRLYRFFRFPVSTIYAYQNKHEIKYREFYGNFMTAHKDKQGHMPLSMTGKENQKIRFVSMVLRGLNPIKAWRVELGKNLGPVEIPQIHRRLNVLMNDKVIIRELKDQLAPFLTEMEKSFTDESLVTEIKSLLENSNKGTVVHRDNIEFVLGILNKMPVNLANQKRKLTMQIEETGPPIPD